MARALATRPRIVFADQPTGNLDSRAGAGTDVLIRSASTIEADGGRGPRRAGGRSDQGN